MLEAFPRLKLVLAHMGGGFHAETEAVEMIRTIGADRIMFGTDYPWVDLLVPDASPTRGVFPPAET